MAQTNRQVNRHSAPPSARSATPDYIIDLTMDSPVNSCTRPAARRHPRITTTLPDVWPSAEQRPGTADSSVVVVVSTGRLSPAIKRSRTADDSVIDLEASEPARDPPAPALNDSICSQLVCPICLEPMTSKAKPTSTRCGHIYCAQCIQNSLSMSNKCPKCQGKITPKSCLRLYF